MNDQIKTDSTKAKPRGGEGLAAASCSADLIQAAWAQYHGPIIDEGGEEYIPAVPPAFMRGFVDGYEQGKKCCAIVEVLRIAEPVMEAWAKSHELEEWHCRVEDLLGTAYPSFMDLPNAEADTHPMSVKKPSNQPDDSSANGSCRPASCSPVECDTCHHWEWDDWKHGFMLGYCPIFGKVTHKDDGAKCTAWQQIHLENDKIHP